MTVYVVRKGTKRGAGPYLDSDGVWTGARSLAYRTDDRETAENLAEDFSNGQCRVVRLVPRRATYEQGQADERAAIARWLIEGCDESNLTYLARMIAAGGHRAKSSKEGR